MNVVNSKNNSKLLDSLVAPLTMVNNASKNMGFGNVVNVGKNANTGSSWPIFGIIVFLAIVGTIVALLVIYKDELSVAWENMKMMLGFGGEEPAPPSEPENESPPPPSSVPVSPTETPTDSSSSIVEKILPGGGNEVFNVSSNKYTYYDAEPLCKALGAELATYEQVKNAWSKGADWCNYGWSKGQLALYPTSEETYSKLQLGPEDQRMACGKPGLNGGFFDNPELRFGVNCYGKKPPASAHDQADIAKGTPTSPDALAFDKKVNEYKSNADSIGISPFNTGKWSSA